MSGTGPARGVDAWSLADIGDQEGRTIVVTGPSLGGLGHHTALELARRGGRVVLAGRTPAKLAATTEAILTEVPNARLDRLVVDLSDLSSVRAAGAAAERLGAIDCLINNAGVSAIGYRRTPDGLETQLATNHFGPFLLTGLLLPQLNAAPAARVVALSSLVHRVVRRAPLGEPRVRPRRYRRLSAYAGSKLADLLFTYELDRRLREAASPVSALAAHPGFAGTHLASNGAFGRGSGGLATVVDGAVRAISQSAAMGAWPSLMAATADLPGATFVGPSGLGEGAGSPQIVTSTALSHDEDAQRRLWEISEEVTSITYP